MSKKNEILALGSEKIKFEEILNKLIFVIEFIITGILMIYVYKFICIKAYDGYYSRKYLIICAIIGICFLATIIYNFIKNKDKIEKLFLTIAIPIGMAYLVFLIPTYAPDENAHIYRSYEISEGVIVTGTNEDNLVKSYIPRFFVENNHQTLNKYNKMNEVIKKETNYDDKIEIDNPASPYAPTLYFPNTLIFLIGRIFDINGILVIYFARMINFIIFLICGYYTIKLMPFGKLLMMTYLLIPMVVHQAISLSADSITNTLTLLFIAYTLNMYYKENITKKNKIIYIIMAALIAIHKSVYLPIVCISVIFLNRKKETKKEQIKLIGSTVIIGIISVVVWMAISSTGEKVQDNYLIQNNVNTKEQVLYVLTHPFSYIKVLANTLCTNIENYYLWFMGYSMGWMDIGIRRMWLDIYFIILLFSPFLEKCEKKLEIKNKIIFVITFAIVSVLILTALYVGHTGVAGDIIKGIQGRYFIPIIILLLLCLCDKERYIKVKNIQIIYPILILFLNEKVIEYLIRFFI